MKKLSKGKIIALVLSAILVIAFIIISVKVFVDRPQDLGPELEYIGKEYTGCELWQLILFLGGFCQRPDPNDYSYYFSTDLEKDELMTHFSKADYDEDHSLGGTSGYHPSDILVFRKIDTGETFSIQVYDDPEIIKNDFGFKSSGKNVLSIRKDRYLIVQSSL